MKKCLDCGHWYRGTYCPYCGSDKYYKKIDFEMEDLGDYDLNQYNQEENDW